MRYWKLEIFLFFQSSVSLVLLNTARGFNDFGDHSMGTYRKRNTE
jgi:hypothetical protein